MAESPFFSSSDRDSDAVRPGGRVGTSGKLDDHGWSFDVKTFSSIFSPVRTIVREGKQIVREKKGGQGRMKRKKKSAKAIEWRGGSKDLFAPLPSPLKESKARV